MLNIVIIIITIFVYTKYIILVHPHVRTCVRNIHTYVQSRRLLSSYHAYTEVRMYVDTPGPNLHISYVCIRRIHWVFFFTKCVLFGACDPELCF